MFLNNYFTFYGQNSEYFQKIKYTIQIYNQNFAFSKS